jgi:hypothetical protein
MPLMLRRINQLADATKFLFENTVLLHLCIGVSMGCQMVCFQTKNPTLGKFWRVLQWKILAYFMTIWSILRPLEIFYVHLVYFCGHLVYFVVIWYISWPFGIFRGHLVYFVVIWYISPHFGILYQEKSGNPGVSSCTLMYVVGCEGVLC